MDPTVPTRIRRIVGAVFGLDARGALAPASPEHATVRHVRDVAGARTPRVLADVTPPPGSLQAGLTRSEWLTPYGIETLRDETLRLGPGTTLDVRVRDADDEELRRLRDAFAPLGRRGIAVAVRPAAPRTPHEDAA